MTPNPYRYPPEGPLGELAEFIYRAATRPVAEIALAGAVAYMAGVVGRAFNVSNTGLNQYVLLVAETGRGKEGARSGINRFVSYAKSGVWHDGNIPNQFPTIDEHLGPAEISSGQALLKYVGRSRSFVSVVGEFGHTIQRICHPRASSSDVMLRKVILDLYNQSGEHDVLQPTIYSDTAKNLDPVDSPAFSLFGETAPEALYPHLTESMIAIGLLPRFLPIIYEGPRVKQNLTNQGVVPTRALVQWFADLLEYTARLNASNKVVAVAIAPSAYEFIGPQGYVDSFADGIINDGNQSRAVSELWNRAQLKTLKLAALVAVCRDHRNPAIQLHDAQWAYSIVKDGIERLAVRFDSGEVGGKDNDETRQANELVRAIFRYVTTEYQNLPNRDAVPLTMHYEKIVPLSYLAQGVGRMAVFKSDRLGATAALKRTVQAFLDAGDLQEIGRNELAEKFNGRGRAFVISNPSRFIPKR